MNFAGVASYKRGKWAKHWYLGAPRKDGRPAPFLGLWLRPFGFYLTVYALGSKRKMTLGIVRERA